mgnify:CR=1 FL=1
MKSKINRWYCYLKTWLAAGRSERDGERLVVRDGRSAGVDRRNDRGIGAAQAAGEVPVDFAEGRLRRAIRPRHRRQGVEGAENEARSVNQIDMTGGVDGAADGHRGTL